MSYDTHRVGLDGQEDRLAFDEVLLGRTGEPSAVGIWHAPRIADFVAPDRPAPDRTPRRLILLVDNPDDPETIRQAKLRLGLPTGEK